ncbi:MAG: globin domain-containing protein [Planctomycetota bacterium]|jgi:hemoglobin-like flavoprotein
MQLDESLQRVLADKDPIIRRFYDRFLAEQPQAERLFVDVDLEKQALMLTMALIVVEASSRDSYPAVEHYLHVLGDRHREAGIPRELFTPFRDCLIDTIRLSQIDDWDDELTVAWRQALDRATETMFQGYEGDFPF